MKTQVFALCLFATPALAAYPGTAAAPGQGQAVDMLPACKAYIAEKDEVEPFNQGVCAATVSALLSVSNQLPAPHQACPPNGLTIRQGVEAVVKYIEANPAAGTQIFNHTVVEALAKTWACGTGGVGNQGTGGVGAPKQ